MRICAGEFKGRAIKIPKSNQIRPTTDKLREAIFSSLGDDIIDSPVADLFCGSGSLGLEALSRGASTALFVDDDRNSICTLKENVEKLKVWPRAKIMAMNVFKIRPAYLSTCKIIFADPPYKQGYLDRLIVFLSLPKAQWGGIMVLEHETEWSFPGGGISLLKRIDSGDSAVSIFLKKQEQRERIDKGI